MGLLGDLSAWVDNRKRVVARGGLLDPLSRDVADFAARDKSSWDATQSVMPQVREQGVQETLNNWQNVAGLLGAIRVFHGSPHTFDKFDLSKIGTGEGAQAYGHGLYFAENPAVAQQYSEIVNMPKVDAANKRLKELADEMHKLSPNGYRQFKDPRGHDLAAEYDRLMEEKLKADPQMYEASLRWPDPAREAADPLGPQHFLDWDKPLSQQPKAARKALRAADAGLFSDGRYPSTLTAGSDLAARGIKVDAQTVMQGHNPIYRYGVPADAMTGEDYWHLLMRRSQGDANAALQASREAGLPGIRYLDAGSRAAGNGTANYVLFDDALAEILKRNGMPAR